ncbi:MAG: FecR family protein [Polyangiaceae bacterium]|jgi:hypothetical protein
MSAPRFARLASKVFLQKDDRPSAPPSAQARAEAIAKVAAALAMRRRSRHAARWAIGIAAAAVLLVVAGTASVKWRRGAAVALTPRSTAVEIVARSIEGGASVVVSGAQAPLAEGRSIPDGSRLVTPPNGRANLAFSTGTSVTLGEGTDLTVGRDGETQVLQLGTGWVDLHVAKLGPTQRFVVDTADTGVEVRGTKFRVSLVAPDPNCGGGTPTRVVVTEGVVVVRHGGVESRVTADAPWPAGCDAGRGPVSLASGTPRATTSNAATGSSLAEQNNLYARAIAAMRHATAAKSRSDAHEALAAFDQLMAKYPSGPLAESAAVERMRLLHVTDPARAVSAARLYLNSYPNGQARAEAEGIVAGSP